MLTVPIEPVGAGATGASARQRLRLCYFESTAPQNICWAQSEGEPTSGPLPPPEHPIHRNDPYCAGTSRHGEPTRTAIGSRQ